MSDPDLDGAFRNLRAAVLGEVRPAGVPDARRRSRRRRRRQAVAVAVLALIALAVPVAVYAATGSGRKPVPVAPTHSPRPGPSVPSSGSEPGPAPASSSPVFAGTRTNRGSWGFCPPALFRTPAGGLTRDQVCNGTISVPPWPDPWTTMCDSGELTFTDGVHWTGVNAVTLGTPYGAWYTPIYYTDVDHDGAVETVVQVNCNTAASVVVVLRPAPGGGIRTFGIVTSSGTLTGPIDIEEIAVTPSGYVQVDIGGGWITFGWDGTGFARVPGVPDPSGSALPPGSPPPFPVSGGPSAPPSPVPVGSTPVPVAPSR